MNRSIASNSVQPCYSTIAAEDVTCVVYKKASSITIVKFLGKIEIEVFWYCIFSK